MDQLGRTSNLIVRSLGKLDGLVKLGCGWRFSFIRVICASAKRLKLGKLI